MYGALQCYAAHRVTEWHDEVSDAYAENLKPGHTFIMRTTQHTQSLLSIITQVTLGCLGVTTALFMTERQKQKHKMCLMVANLYHSANTECPQIIFIFKNASCMVTACECTCPLMQRCN